jgi:hypothetical protein
VLIGWEVVVDCWLVVQLVTLWWVTPVRIEAVVDRVTPVRIEGVLEVDLVTPVRIEALEVDRVTPVRIEGVLEVDLVTPVRIEALEVDRVTPVRKVGVVEWSTTPVKIDVVEDVVVVPFLKPLIGIAKAELARAARMTNDECMMADQTKTWRRRTISDCSRKRRKQVSSECTGTVGNNSEW